MRGGLGGGQLPFVHHGLDERVVVSDLEKLPLAERQALWT
jgi:hypothetical protein